MNNRERTSVATRTPEVAFSAVKTGLVGVCVVALTTQAPGRVLPGVLVQKYPRVNKVGLPLDMQRPNESPEEVAARIAQNKIGDSAALPDSFGYLGELQDPWYPEGFTLAGCLYRKVPGAIKTSFLPLDDIDKLSLPGHRAMVMQAMAVAEGETRRDYLWAEPMVRTNNGFTAGHLQQTIGGFASRPPVIVGRRLEQDNRVEPLDVNGSSTVQRYRKRER